MKNFPSKTNDYICKLCEVNLEVKFAFPKRKTSYLGRYFLLELYCLIFIISPHKRMNLE